MINLVVGTKNFNKIDKIVASWRLGQVVNLIKKNDEVLDFGCGSQGFLLRLLENKIKKGVGVDDEVEKEKGGKLEFINFRYSSKLPKNLGLFDKVTMLAVLEHVEPLKINNLISEFKKVLKVKGKIVITTPTPRSKPILELLAKLGVISRVEIRDHKKYYDKKDLLSLAKANRLKLVSYQLFLLGLNSVAVFEKS